MRLTRYKMYRRIQECFKEPIKGDILGISAVDGLYPIIDLKNSNLLVTSYPEVDFQNLCFKDGSFDAVISDQVLEHLTDPPKAINESYRVLRPGGIAIHTTCFMNYYHPSPIDYWRMSPEALGSLCRNAGFREIIQCEGWGNRAALILCLMSDRFRAMEIPSNGKGLRAKIASMNEERYPIVTWVIARK